MRRKNVEPCLPNVVHHQRAGLARPWQAVNNAASLGKVYASVGRISQVQAVVGWQAPGRRFWTYLLPYGNTYKPRDLR